MDFAAGIVAAVLLLDVAFAWAVVAGRRGSTKPHRLAFTAGLVGLVALPLWFFGLIGLVTQHFFAEIASPAGILLVSMTAVLVVAAGCAVLGSISCCGRQTAR